MEVVEEQAPLQINCWLYIQENFKPELLELPHIEDYCPETYRDKPYIPRYNLQIITMGNMHNVVYGRTLPGIYITTEAPPNGPFSLLFFPLGTIGRTAAVSGNNQQGGP